MKKKKIFKIVSGLLIFSMLFCTVSAYNGRNNRKKSMEELINENLIKTEKIVIKNEQGESVRTEEIESPAQNISTYSLTNSSDNQTQEEIQLASGETAVYVEQYSNIQDLRKAIERNYPEKDDEEVAKDILLAINQEDLAENMTTGELINALEFKDTCGMGAIPLSSNNTVSLASVNNEYGSLDENREDLNSYIFAAYCGKNGAGNAEFYAYSTIRWKQPLNSNFRDVIVLGSTVGETYYKIENRRLEPGIKGYLSNVLECRNNKYPLGQAPNGQNISLYSIKNINYYFETLKVDNEFFSNCDNQVTVDIVNNTIVCTAPMNLGNEKCHDSYPGYNMIHSTKLKDVKMFVSGYYVSNPLDTVSSFASVYYHTKKELSANPSVALGISYKYGSGFSVNGSLGVSFSEKYVEQEYYSPKINVQFNQKGEFYGFN